MDAKNIISYHYPIQLKGILTLKERKVWKIEALEGPFILKALDFPLEESVFIISAMNHLSAAGFEKFNFLKAAKNGESLVRDEGKCFFLSRFVPGHPADYQQMEEVEAAALTLSELHLSAVGFDPPPFPGRMKWSNWPQMIAAKTADLQRFGKQVAEKRRKDYFDCLYLRHYPYYLEEMEAAAGYFNGELYERVWKSQKKAGGFCHHDLAYHNFLIDEAGTAALVDFDYAIADLRVHDLANFLNKLLKHHNWDETVALSALEAYDKKGTLSHDERKLLLGMLRLPQDFWQVAFARYVEKSREALRLEKKMQRWTGERGLRHNALRILEKAL